MADSTRIMHAGVREDASQGSERLKKCADCDTLIPRRRDAPRRCEPCAREAKKRRNANCWSKHKPAPTTFVCQDCSGTFQRDPVSKRKRKRCDDCRKAEAYRVSRRSMEKLLAEKRAYFEKHGRPSECLSCGAVLDNVRTGPVRRACQACKKAGVNVPRPVDTSKYGDFTCQGCGGTFPNRAFNRVSTYCRPCSPKQAVRRVADWRRSNVEVARECRRRARHVRRARLASTSFERFDLREVFERDRWRCQICSRRINPSLQHPHPLSASIDHVVPVSQGGGHVRSNVRASHFVCNSRRGARGGNEQLMLIG